MNPLDSLKPYLTVGLVVAGVVALGFAGNWLITAGHVAERSAWQTKDNEELRRANEKIVALNNAARDEEAKQATRLTGIATYYEKELKDGKAQRDKDIADAYAGALSLHVTPSIGFKASGGEIGTITPGPRVGDGETGCQLPRETTADLLALVDDADEVTKQLGACQAVVRSDRGEE